MGTKSTYKGEAVCGELGWLWEMGATNLSQEEQETLLDYGFESGGVGSVFRDPVEDSRYRREMWERYKREFDKYTSKPRLWADMSEEEKERLRNEYETKGR